MYMYVFIILILAICYGCIIFFCKNNTIRAVLLTVSCLIYFACVYWITLGSRYPFCENEIILLPFVVYIDMITSSWKSTGMYILFAIVGNIILFIPIGMMISQISTIKHKCLLSGMVGFFLSLAIEVLQFFFLLGTFEVDDLLHNTWGAVIGCSITLVLIRKEKSIKANVKMLTPLLLFIGLISIASLLSIIYD